MIDYIIGSPPSDFLNAVWFIAVAWAIHEFEEWNIVKWEQQNFEGSPPMTNRGARIWMIIMIILVFAFAAAAYIPGNPTIAAYVFIPVTAFLFQNAVQHIYWSIRFKNYAPGAMTALFLLLPLVV